MSAWVDGVELFGSGNLSLSEILQPAISLAEEGYPVAPVCAHYWKLSEQLLQTASPNGNEMLKNGEAPKEGEIMQMNFLAQTFRAIASNGKAGKLFQSLEERFLKKHC